MTKSVATPLTIFAGLMLIVFGLKTGLTEHYLEPTGLTENAYSSERDNSRDSPKGTDLDALSCGTAWSPHEAAPDQDDPAAENSESRLSQFGENRCEAILAGTGWSAALLTISGAGIWFILLFGALARWDASRRQTRDAEEDHLIQQKVALERRRREFWQADDRSSVPRADQPGTSDPDEPSSRATPTTVPDGS